MKKILISFVLASLSLIISAQEKNDFTTALKPYLKINPFQKDLNSFLAEILNDPDFIPDTQIMKTDSTLFYLRGYYKTFNPFKINTAITELQIYHSLIQNKITGVADTTIVYSIIGVSDSVRNYQEIFQEEARVIYKNVKPYFLKTIIEKNKKKQPHTYYYYYMNILPHILSTGYGLWYKDKRKYALDITLNLTLATELME